MPPIVRLTAEKLPPIEYSRMRPLLKGIPQAEWPISDQKRLARALKSRRPSQKRSASKRSEVDLRNLILAYGIALRWLQMNGLLDPAAKPADRWPAELLERYVIWLEANFAHATVVHRLEYLKQAIVELQPKANVGRFRNALKHQGRPRPRTREGLATTPELRDLSSELRTAGRQLIAEDPIGGARLLRDGLLLGFLAMLLPRPKELLVLTYGQPGTHLYWIGHEWRIKLRAFETKTKIETDDPVPEELVSDLELYLLPARSILCGDQPVGPVLWLSNAGEKLSALALSRMCNDRVHKRYQKKFSPHQARKAGTTFLAEHAPEDIDCASDLMGNSKPVRDVHYNSGTVESAVDRVNTYCERLKVEARLLRGAD